MHISKQSKIILFYYIFIAIWGLGFYFLGIKQTLANYLYQFAFGLIPLLGGISGIIKSKKWGFFHSQFGKALFFISAGTTSWGIGQMFWSVLYNLILKMDIPYPSLADVGYICAVPLWAIGIINLSKATGAKFSLRKLEGKILFFIIPLILVAVSYYLLVVIARGGIISSSEEITKVFFDFAYPIGDVIILTFALLIYGLSVNYLGGRFKPSILSIIIGFVVMYFADFSFSYVTTNQTYFNGHWVDILFPTAMMFIAFGINNFDIKNS